jgi:hypothetical protein
VLGKIEIISLKYRCRRELTAHKYIAEPRTVIHHGNIIKNSGFNFQVMEKEHNHI